MFCSILLGLFAYDCATFFCSAYMLSDLAPFFGSLTRSLPHQQDANLSARYSLTLSLGPLWAFGGAQFGPPVWDQKLEKKPNHMKHTMHRPTMQNCLMCVLKNLLLA